MHAQLDLRVRAIEWTPEKVEKKGLRDLIQKIRSGISKHVTVDKDAIFKDPNWPHLWS